MKLPRKWKKGAKYHQQQNDFFCLEMVLLICLKDCFYFALI
jgi:hypothetical protein